MCMVLHGDEVENVFDVQNLVAYRLTAMNKPFMEKTFADEIYTECKMSPCAPSKEVVCRVVNSSVKSCIARGTIRRYESSQILMPYNVRSYTAYV